MRVKEFALVLGSFILLHSPSGREIFIDVQDAHVILRRAEQWTKNACTEINVHDSKFAVRECPREIMDKIEAARSKQ